MKPQGPPRRPRPTVSSPRLPAWALLFGLAFLSLFPAAAPGAGSPSPAQGALSEEEIRHLVGFLEDPGRRETFLKDLKALLRARAEAGHDRRTGPPAREPLTIESLFGRFEAVSGVIVAAVQDLKTLAEGIPGTLATTAEFLSAPETRIPALTFAAEIAFCLLLAFLARLPLQRILSRLDGGLRGPLALFAFPSIRAVFALIPYGLLLLGMFFCFDLFPTFPLIQALALVLFTFVFLYHGFMELARILLSPGDPPRRLLPLSDPLAVFLWSWAARLGVYSAFLGVTLQAVYLVSFSFPLYGPLRSLLLLGYPCLLTLFILRLHRLTRNKEGVSGTATKGLFRGPGRLLLSLTRLWPHLATIYAWLLFLFLVFNFSAGYRYLLKATAKSIVLLLALLLFVEGVRWGKTRLTALNERLKGRLPGLEERTRRYILLTARAASLFAYAAGLLSAAGIWGLPVARCLAEPPGSLLIVRGISILLITALVLALMEVSECLKGFFLNEGPGPRREVSQKARTLIPMVTTSLKIGMGFIGGILILGQLGIDTTPILAGAGIVGLAVGFGSQTLVKDLINGLFILFEETIRVGDFVDLGTNAGLVEAVGLRTLRLRDLDGSVHVIPNSAITTLKNMSMDFSMAVIDVGVAYREDVDAVMGILEEVGEEMVRHGVHGKDILEPLEIMGLQELADSAMVIRVRLKTRPLKQWALKREFLRRVKKTFDARGIEIPFPTRTLYLGPTQDPQGEPHHETLETRSGSA